MSQLAIVVWEDAFATEGTFEKAKELEHESESFKITSLGWLVRETAKIVTLAMDVEGDGEDKNYRDIKRIRRENIRNLVILDTDSFESSPLVSPPQL